jgi:hypothetical protein
MKVISWEYFIQIFQWCVCLILAQLQNCAAIETWLFYSQTLTNSNYFFLIIIERRSPKYYFSGPKNRPRGVIFFSTTVKFHIPRFGRMIYCARLWKRLDRHVWAAEEASGRPPFYSNKEVEVVVRE